jgi:transcriptional regulator with XRE-family HTH domain
MAQLKISEENLSKRKDFLQKIKKIRQAKGISIYTLAEMTGIRPSNISVIERGAHAVQIDTILRILSALNCDIDISSSSNFDFVIQ